MDKFSIFTGQIIPLNRANVDVEQILPLRFLNRTEKTYSSAPKICVIADNARYYRSKLETDYLAGSKIEILFLPAYTLNLNLIERFWKFFKKKVQINQNYPTYEEFVDVCKRFFRQRKRHNVELHILLTENFQLFTI